MGTIDPTTVDFGDPKLGQVLSLEFFLVAHGISFDVNCCVIGPTRGHVFIQKRALKISIVFKPSYYDKSLSSSNNCRGLRKGIFLEKMSLCR